MKAIVLDEFGPAENLRLAEVPDPVPEEGEVLVRVRVCGVCYHDLLTRQGAFPRAKRPVILGHQVGGDVVAVGPGVRSFRPGDRVISLPFATCGRCDTCLSGRDTLCEETPLFLGEDIDGGYAELVKAPERTFCPLPDGLSYEAGCTLACTAGTAYHAAVVRGGIRPGEVVLVTGASGGVGQAAVQFARMAGAEVIAVTSSPAKAPALAALGVDHVVVSPDLRFQHEVKALTGGRGCDVVLEVVGSATFEASVHSLRPGGRLVFVGNVEGRPVQVKPAWLILKELAFIGTKGITVPEMHRVLALAAAGRLRPVECVELPLEQAAEAHRMVAERRAPGRVLLRP
ncbi:MAG: zinc-binding dehydrogenase [Clostridia bacterium]|nr:zinc-binding dehydrogenase [Clostridia bacterium]